MRHGDIQDSHIRLVRVGQTQGLRAVGGLANDDHSRLLQEDTDPLADYQMIFGQEDANRHQYSPLDVKSSRGRTPSATGSGAAAGNVIWSVVPCPRTELIWRVPPKASRRSWMPRRPRPRGPVQSSACSTTNPAPSSRRRPCTPSPSRHSWRSTWVAAACLVILVMPSCMMR